MGSLLLPAHGRCLRKDTSSCSNTMAYTDTSHRTRAMKGILGLLFLCCVTLLGCNSNSNPVADNPSPQKKVAWVGIVFRNPITNTTDANAVTTSGLIASMNAQAAAPWLRPFDTIAEVSFKNIDQWTLVSGSLTEVLTRTAVGDSVFGCTLKFNGTVPGTTYTNALAYSDSNRADGKYGYWAEYYLPTEILVRPHEFSYAVNAQGTSTGKDILLPDGPQIVIADSANGSGAIVKSTLVASTFFVVSIQGAVVAGWVRTVDIV